MLMGRSYTKDPAKLIRRRTLRKNKENPIQEVQHVTFDGRIPVHQQRVQHDLSAIADFRYQFVLSDCNIKFLQSSGEVS